MNRNDFIQMEKRFSNYVSGFYTDNMESNSAIQLKADHTKRVRRQIVSLCEKLSLSGRDMILAETTALFHDIGRFQQYKDYKTFNDRISVNHARLGVKLLAVNNLLKGYTNDEKRLISKAVAYHNAAVLPEDENAKILLFMRLIRDADKLDIWKIYTDYYNSRSSGRNKTIELGLPDDPVCSREIIRALCEKRFARVQDIKTLNDYKLLQLSWVFDLNFVPSFQAVQNYMYLEKIEAALPESREIKEAVKHAYNYVKKNAGG